MHDKLNALEEMLAHQDRQIQDLNDVVTRQWDEIDVLKRNLQRLGAKMQEMEVTTKDGDSLSVSEEAALNKPPHY
ncbi:MAG: SlyX family protein [Alphaproteobacteria bacterium]|nr:SlyX family protein [Alphaproteobacteria bacterium]NCQ88525.1 SlyX family protein [Alphaproteobacteria bacterium]NCT06068.1 SlyX family protein [Alphaproteobacteria bacterium]